MSYRTGNGKLQPPAGDWAGRGRLLQWIIFSESELTVSLLARHRPCDSCHLPNSHQLPHSHAPSPFKAALPCSAAAVQQTLLAIGVATDSTDNAVRSSEDGMFSDVSHECAAGEPGALLLALPSVPRGAAPTADRRGWQVSVRFGMILMCMCAELSTLSRNILFKPRC